MSAVDMSYVKRVILLDFTVTSGFLWLGNVVIRAVDMRSTGTLQVWLPATALSDATLVKLFTHAVPSPLKLNPYAPMEILIIIVMVVIRNYNQHIDRIARCLLLARYHRSCCLDPRAVAVSCYGWLKTSYGWLAG